jgi:plastocyanin
MLITLVVLIFSKCSLATTIDLKIVDLKGTPVANAVISIPQLLESKQTNIEIMDQVDKQFSPYVLLVQKGQAVDFPNSDDIRHHVYSFSQPKQFEIKLFSGGEAQPVTFENEGVVVLGCNIHDSMIGYIYVNGGELTAMTDSQGIASLELGDTSSLAEVIQVTFWHPELSPIQTERVTLNLPSKTLSHSITLPFTLAAQAKDVTSGFKKKFGS